jgi:hypothetical protein
MSNNSGIHFAQYQAVRGTSAGWRQSMAADSIVISVTVVLMLSERHVEYYWSFPIPSAVDQVVAAACISSDYGVRPISWNVTFGGVGLVTSAIIMWAPTCLTISPSSYNSSLLSCIAAGVSPQLTGWWPLLGRLHYTT